MSSVIAPQQETARDTIAAEALRCLEHMGVAADLYQQHDLPVVSPVTGKTIATVGLNRQTADDIAALAQSAFQQWREVPAPVRGKLVRIFGELLRSHKQALGKLVSIECGKILQEGLGEVQEMIDICDFAVGLSRQLHGLTIASERPLHKMQENWHPLGPVLIISAFNFPVAVWSWNAALALVCGNSIIWKPSEKTPLTALACQTLLRQAMKACPEAPEHLSQLVIGDATQGQSLAAHSAIPLVSATGSTRMGREIAPLVAARFGRCILELGGNNAIIVTPSADLDMATRAILFGAVGSAGQRCTTTRRLFCHEAVFDTLLEKLKAAWQTIRVGNPLAAGTLVGPLIDQHAIDAMQAKIAMLAEAGATIEGGEVIGVEGYEDGFYVRPCLIEMPDDITNEFEEIFAPLLYCFRYQDLAEAISRNNEVSQGLSSAIFTNDLREAERFTSATGSDCGISNVNIGTSGAEIGGAFGGEKDTGGGRESGSDAWKGYMRRSTNTINYGTELPLAQGISFD
ncbi:MAG: aldehyde dehydrogenase family protein [Pseudomonadales bacterium]|nr:aldehyde dehydrogenase family protein [Pseudomonadales bacterium]